MSCPLSSWQRHGGSQLDFKSKCFVSIKAWQDDYNHHRPHGSLGHLTPSEFARMRSVQPPEAGRL
ncbi:MAG: transposase [Zoogloeaceae bacterium]|nr:transposase [Zoogloeaceae bacterium]